MKDRATLVTNPCPAKPVGTRSTKRELVRRVRRGSAWASHLASACPSAPTRSRRSPMAVSARAPSGKCLLLPSSYCRVSRASAAQRSRQSTGTVQVAPIHTLSTVSPPLCHCWHHWHWQRRGAAAGRAHWQRSVLAPWLARHVTSWQGTRNELTMGGTLKLAWPHTWHAVTRRDAPSHGDACATSCAT